MTVTTTLTVRVYYEDTDFSGIVYHANYLKFFERGRTEGLREITGLNHAAVFEGDDPIAFTVRRLTVEFIRPAHMDDLLEVRTTITSAKGARMTFQQGLWRDDECLATAEVDGACMTIRGRPRRLPPEIMRAFTA